MKTEIKNIFRPFVIVLRHCYFILQDNLKYVFGVQEDLMPPRTMNIVANGISWCSANITPKYPNFQFIHADVFNKRYNPTGGTIAANYIFPLENNHFDFVILTSVLTHMVAADMENYLSEIARVLKPNGKCFILHKNSITLIRNGKSSLDFKYDCGMYRVEDRKVPESAISYVEDFILKAFRNNGLQVINPRYCRSWSVREVFASYQDIIIAEKKSFC